MIGEFLMRLAVALPLVSALAALSLVAVRRGWLRLPAFGAAPRPAAAVPVLEVRAMHALSPTARLAVVRFDGRELLLGCTPQAVTLVAAASGAPGPIPSSPTIPEAEQWKA